MNQKELAFKKISELVVRFDEQYDSYKKSDYNETLTRRDFIDPFFKALGWDIDNENGYAESYREVIHEDKVKVGKATKAPDYSFRLVGGKRLFFVEAKKPSVSIKDEICSAYQVRRYGWSAKLSISIITDFEEFAIYDCTCKPLPTDKASVSRIKYLTFRDYLKEFDFIWESFSKEQVLKGSFDKFVKGSANKRGTATVDKEFLLSLDSWRTYLATSISWNNKQLDEDEINFVVQQTIDRIIFLRIAEDRSVEPYGNLKNAIKQGDYYQNLFTIFGEADDKYNSGLFDFKKDKFSKDVKIDNKVIKTIINELYYPLSPYEFSVLAVEILGSAYEQFLGKVIRITPSHHAKIEEKPEVRKAGGVYYTPQYVVEYIVKNTVGKLLENNTPKEISKIKIVDPACGSGSFLIGAYQCLLDWHKDYYTGNGKISKGIKSHPLTPEGNLTTAEKKRILLNNIFGVDIDVNAVEVTKLSLLLKCMEGETNASIASQFQLFNERVLPTLDNNIKDGNSLIDIDYYALQLDFGDEKKVKPFNWQKAFPAVFKQGGFDVVIGNPPYVFTRDVDWSDEIKNYYWKKFEISKNDDNSRKNQSGKINLYILFILKATELINKSGQVSYIIPNGFLRTTTYDTTRKFLLQKTSVNDIIDLKDRVFDGVTASTIIIRYSNFKNDNIIKIIDADFKRDGFIDETRCSYRKQNLFLKNVSYTFSIFIDESQQKIFNKLNSSNFYFKEIIIDIIEGIVAHKEFLSEEKLNDKWKAYLEGKDIKRYQINYNSRYILFDRKKLHRARPDYVWNSKKKIIIQRISGGSAPLVAAIDENYYYSFASTNLLLLKNEFIDEYSYELICGLLNSNLLNFYYSKNFSNSSNLTVNISKTFLEMLPLPTLLPKMLIEEIVKSVLLISNLKEEVKSVKLQTKVSQFESKIDYCEQRINEIVYQLYDLTAEEIKIVEEK